MHLIVILNFDEWLFKQIILFLISEGRQCLFLYFDPHVNKFFLTASRNQHHLWVVYIWAAPCENVSSGVCRHRRPSASAHPDQGFYCLLTEYFSTKECLKGEKARMIICACKGLYEAAHLRMLERTFPLDAANLIWQVINFPVSMEGW